MEIYKDRKVPIEDRVKDLLSRMTVEEKIAQMDMEIGVNFADKTHPAYFGAISNDAEILENKLDEIVGVNGMGFVHSLYTQPNKANKIQKYFVEKTRLGIPAIFICEALHGVHMPDATPFPIPLALAASFNREIVYDVGRKIAKEVYVTGHREVLNPNLDLAREPRWGRMEETFGEDVYLASEMGYEIVTGLQGEDLSDKYSVGAEPKHYLAHGIAEGGLNSAPARVGRREVETCYLPVFESGIKRAGAISAMASYNSIDGEPLMNSEYYLTDVLKKRLNLRGYIRSDFGGIKRLNTIHKVAPSIEDAISSSINAGLDTQGLDFPNAVWQRNIHESYKKGKISLQTINEAVRRILTIKFEMGLYENPYIEDEQQYIDVLRGKESLETAYNAAKESICLLKNDNKQLPLDEQEYSSIAVIGPFSDNHQIGGYSPMAYSYKHESVYDVLKEKFDNKKVIKKSYGTSSNGRMIQLIPDKWFKADDFDGVTCEYYIDDDFDKDPVFETREEKVDFVWLLKKPYELLPDTGFGLNIKGKFKVDISDFTDDKVALGQFVINTADPISLKVDGKKIVDYFDNNNSNAKRQIEGFENSSIKEKIAEFTFEQGSIHDFEIELIHNTSGYVLLFSYELLEDQIDNAIKLAANSDIVFMVCGDDQMCSGEGFDRSKLTLPGKQHELIEKVYEVNKNIILILQTGRPVVLDFERGNIDVIIQSWFSGEKGSQALIDMIFGEYSPSGKTPISWPKSIGHIPSYYTKLPGTSSSRYHDSSSSNIFEFGYGLS